MKVQEELMLCEKVDLMLFFDISTSYNLKIDPILSYLFWDFLGPISFCSNLIRQIVIFSSPYAIFDPPTCN
jgi:hypothetical protein